MIQYELCPCFGGSGVRSPGWRFSPSCVVGCCRSTRRTRWAWPTTRHAWWRLAKTGPALSALQARGRPASTALSVTSNAASAARRPPPWSRSVRHSSLHRARGSIRAIRSPPPAPRPRLAALPVSSRSEINGRVPTLYGGAPERVPADGVVVAARFSCRKVNRGT